MRVTRGRWITWRSTESGRETRIQSTPPLATLCQSAGCRGRTVVSRCVRGLTVWAPWSHDVSEVSRPSSRAHVPASSAARALTNTHKQTTCDERALLCSHRPFLRRRTFLSGVFPVFEATRNGQIRLPPPRKLGTSSTPKPFFDSISPRRRLFFPINSKGRQHSSRRRPFFLEHF